MENYATPNQDEQNAVPVSDQVLPNTPESFTPFAPAEAGGQKPSGYKDEGWSWGGFAFNVLFLIAIRKYKFLLIFILIIVLGNIFLAFSIEPLLSNPGLFFVIPLIPFFLVLVMVFFLGIKGRKFARESRTFSNYEQYLGFMKGVDHAGKVFILVYTGLFVVGILASILLVSLGSARDRARDAEFKTQQQTAEMQYQVEMEDNR
jgi:hypothetical protein